MRNSFASRCITYINANKRTILAFTSIFFIFAFFRFINLDLRIGFSWDQQQFSTQVRDIIRDHKFTLLGPRVTDDRGFFLAPYFTYLLIPFFLITNLHPSALMIFIIILNLCFFGFAAYTITGLFGKQQALLFLFLWAINPIIIKYDITPWWPILLPFGVLLIIYQLKQFYNSPLSFRYWIALGITVGFFCNMHFQFVFIGAFVALFITIKLGKQLWHYWIHLLLMFCSFIVMFIPLIIFDLRHNHLNYSLFTTYFEERVFDDLPYMEAWQPVLSNLLKPFTWTTQPVTSIIFLIGLTIIFLSHAYKTQGFKKTFYISSALLLLTTIIGFSLYGRRPSEYYFTYLLPFIYLGLSELLTYLNKQYITCVILIYLVGINIVELKNCINEDPFSLYYMDAAVQKIIPYAEGKRVNVSYDMPPGFNNGYDYLIDYYKINRTGDPNDPLIEMRIPPRKEDIVIKNIGIHIPPELK